MAKPEPQRVPRRSPADLTGDRQPFAISVEGASPAVLAFHGFGGTPFEIELVTEAARSLGLAARAPLLPGHGTSAHELSRTGWEDWSRAAHEAFATMPGEVILVGFSMGSLLAIDLATKAPERVRALVLLANAAWLQSPFPDLALYLVDRLKIPDFLARKRGPDIADAEARVTHVSYGSHPVHSANEVRRAGIRARERLGLVRCPTLILHGAKDRVCPVANAWRVAEHLGTDDCRVVIYPRSKHILTRDLEHRAVAQELRAFLARIQHESRAEASPAQTPVDP